MDNRISCFVIMPYSDAADSVYTDGILPALKSVFDKDILALRADKMGPQAITVRANVEGAIQTADFCIADITGNNPNVMFELGYASAQRKPTIVVRQAGAGSAPANVRDIAVLEYDPKRLDRFRDELTNVINRLVGSRNFRPASESVKAFSTNLLGDDAMMDEFLDSIRFTLSVLVASPRFFNQRLLPVIRAKGDEGVMIRIVCSDPEGEFARIRARDSSMSVQSYRNDLWAQVEELRHTLMRMKRGQIELRLTNQIVATSLYLSDTTALVLPYLAAGRSRESVGLAILKEDNPRGFALFLQQFGNAWEMGTSNVGAGRSAESALGDEPGNSE